ncbi:DUF602 domain-containing protein [Histoplasma capsulatum G186AR]|uniref:DUF602 domain-containing protein n=2 Tax=Ajellomyces capsulatus TaxID=5037 RepID=C0NVA2_AJECG|nr:DUF602 domain-containing protein [Histoplasma capsulatum G186AR]EEH04441.1 DUF602 domain-containing protein [Histoplasma capsulatum G186AR]KAG5296274.1 DUF602 domain-containing protein [Histoplasma capsulatum]QSS74256.1 DUF602 domain-containing protein [Histoplasma capsulatum G186AR]
MGNDGGSIPRRCELVKSATRNPTTTELKETLREHLEHYWSTCPLSHKQLLAPIVSDSSGTLYNKDAILKFLLPADDTEDISSKADCEEILKGRVKGLRDIVEVKFEIDDGGDGKKRRVCPITRKELGPNVKSVYLVPCGHAFSEEAIREMKSDKCLQCNEGYLLQNVIPILPSQDAEKKRLISRVQDLNSQGLTHSLKKAPGSNKKRKKNGNSAESTASTTTGSEPASALDSGTATSKHQSAPSSRPDSVTSTPAPSGIKNAATARLTARVLEEERERNKRRKMIGDNETIRSLFSSDSTRERGKDSDFMTRGYSIPTSAKR